jgi:hypothetical protein
VNLESRLGQSVQEDYLEYVGNRRWSSEAGARAGVQLGESYKGHYNEGEPDGGLNDLEYEEGFWAETMAAEHNHAG